MANLFRIPGHQMTVGAFYGAEGAEVPAHQRLQEN
jgi:hypothetical protein